MSTPLRHFSFNPIKSFIKFSGRVKFTNESSVDIILKNEGKPAFPSPVFLPEIPRPSPMVTIKKKL